MSDSYTLSYSGAEVDNILTKTKQFVDNYTDRMPYIGENGNWFKWNDVTTSFEDTGLPSLPKSIKVELPADGWSETAPYTQTIYITNMTEEWKAGAFTLISTGNLSNDLIMQEESSRLTYIDTGNGFITFTCGINKPTSDIVLMIPQVKIEEEF